MFLGQGITPFSSKAAAFSVPTSLCSYYFDGVDGGATLGSQLNATIEGAATFSLRMVFKIPTTGINEYIFANDVSFRINKDTANKLNFWYRSGAAWNVTNFIAAINTDWNELIATYDEGTITYYINGVSANFAFWFGSAPATIDASGILAKLGHSGVDFGNSYINQIQITSDIITASEATALNNSGSPLVGGDSLDNVVGDYVFDTDTFDGTNWTLIDRTGGGNGVSIDLAAIDKDCNENPY